MGNQEGEVEWCSGDPACLIAGRGGVGTGGGGEDYFAFEVPTHNFGQSRCCG